MAPRFAASILRRGRSSTGAVADKVLSGHLSPMAAARRSTRGHLHAARPVCARVLLRDAQRAQNRAYGFRKRLFAGNHQVGVLARGEHKLLGAGADGTLILRAHILGRAAALGHVARQAALVADLGIGPHVHLCVQHGAQLGPIQHEQTSHNQIPGGLDAPSPGDANVAGEREHRLLERPAFGDGLKMLPKKLPFERVGVIEVQLFTFLKRQFFPAAIVGIEGNNGGARQLLNQAPRQLRLPGAGWAGDADNVRFHACGRKTSSIASTRPSMVKTRAPAATSMPRPRAVWVVTGPMETTLTPWSEAAPATSTKFRTVDELVKAMASGLLAAPKISRACRAAPMGRLKRGVEFRDDDERAGTRRQDVAGDRSGETTGARNCLGSGRKWRGRGDYLSRVGARGSGGDRRVGRAWRGGAGGAVRCYRRNERSRDGEGSGGRTGGDLSAGLKCRRLTK